MSDEQVGQEDALEKRAVPHLQGAAVILEDTLVYERETTNDPVLTQELPQHAVVATLSEVEDDDVLTMGAELEFPMLIVEQIAMVTGTGGAAHGFSDPPQEGAAIVPASLHPVRVRVRL